MNIGPQGRRGCSMNSFSSYRLVLVCAGLKFLDGWVATQAGTAAPSQSAQSRDRSGARGCPNPIWTLEQLLVVGASGAVSSGDGR